MYLSQRASTFTVLFSLIWLTAQAITAQLSFASTHIYSYINDAGVQTFTNEFDSIPDKYRNQITQREDEAPPPAGPVVTTAPSPPSADSRTVTASGEHRMSDHDTRTDAVRLAVEAAKKDALEQVATYLESVTEVRNMDVTRDDIRSFTAGIVKIVNQSVTPRLEDGAVVIRADLTAEIDPHEVAQAIAALRENDSAKQEFLALRAETDRLQDQLDATSRALAAAPSPGEVQQLAASARTCSMNCKPPVLCPKRGQAWSMLRRDSTPIPHRRGRSERLAAAGARPLPPAPSSSARTPTHRGSAWPDVTPNRRSLRIAAASHIVGPYSAPCAQSSVTAAADTRRRACKGWRHRQHPHSTLHSAGDAPVCPLIHHLSAPSLTFLAP